MSVINDFGAFVGVLIGAAFVLVGGLLLPLIQVIEEHKSPQRKSV